MSQRHLLKSSTFRLALVYMGLFGSSVLFLLGFIYWSTAAYMAHQADETIQAEIAGLAERYRSDGLTGLSSVLARRSTSRVGGNALYLLTDEFGTPLVGNLDRWPPVTPEPNGWLNFSLEHAGPRDEIHPARAQPFVLEGGYRLLVGLDMQELQQTERRIVTALIWGLAITLLLALAGGTLMSRSMVRRIESINQTSSRIIHGDLSRRIPTEDSDDDFDHLAANLNRMLDRIQALMEDVRRVSDNIAHDLKTPLTRLRNSLELLGAAQEDPEERQQLVEGALGEADGLLATFNALLRIARIESGARREEFRPVDLAGLVRDVFELYQPLAEEKGQRLTLDVRVNAQIQGDRSLLSQALANLLDNAVKYTPAGGEIGLGLRTEDQAPVIVVSDSGPGIPEPERGKVFTRFYRLETSRSTPGNGLGLSLVAAVAELHRVHIALDDNRPGLVVRLLFSPNINNL